MLIHTQHQNAYTYTTSNIFTIFTIKTKKEQAKKSSQVYMIPYTIINQKVSTCLTCREKSSIPARSRFSVKLVVR